jgi:membrane-associated protease RseP (regulator of RpoE activity)
MVGPYRIPGPVEPDFPARCSAPPEPCTCSVRSPERPRFANSIAAALIASGALSPGYAKAVAAAATTALLVVSACLSALTYTAVLHEARRMRGNAKHPQHTAIAAQAPLVQARAGVDPIGGLGQDTHAVGELWRRAEALAASGADVTLARATLPRTIAEEDAATLHVVPEAHWGGLRIAEVGERSAAALAGVRKGDVITAVNGFALRAPEDAVRAFGAIREEHALVAELWRHGQRVVLRVDWSAAPHLG